MRLLDLFEKSKLTRTLFRGDAEEIRQFTMSKTDPGAMVGRGIYLTSSHDVAKDYTVKGATPVYRSEQNYPSDPRNFLQHQFHEQLSKKLGPAYAKLNDAISQQGGRFDRLFQNEIDSTIGTDKNAQTHHRYEELRQWKYKALGFTHAYMWAASIPALIGYARELYDQEYKGFKETLKNTRMLTTVLKELVVIKDSDIGHVTRFRIPITYLDRTYRIDDPMPSWLTHWIMAYIGDTLKWDPRENAGDMRYEDPTRGETRAKNFPDWMKKYQQFGMRFAWADHHVGGEGKDPSLVDFTMGTHLGLNLSTRDDYKFWDDLREELIKRGYVGFHYNGGNMTGRGIWAGGSPVKHDAFALWDDKTVQGTKVSSKPADLPGVDPSQYARFRFTSIERSIEQAVTQHTDQLKTRTDVANYDQIELTVQRWVNSEVPKLLDAS